MTSSPVGENCWPGELPHSGCSQLCNWLVPLRPKLPVSMISSFSR